MSRKDFVVIARVLARAKAVAADEVERAVVARVVDEMTRTLAMENPTFNAAIFVKACNA